MEARVCGTDYGLPTIDYGLSISYCLAAQIIDTALCGTDYGLPTFFQNMTFIIFFADVRQVTLVRAMIILVENL